MGSGGRGQNCSKIYLKKKQKKLKFSFESLIFLINFSFDFNYKIRSIAKAISQQKLGKIKTIFSLMHSCCVF